MPAMTIAELHKWIAEHFPHAPADVQIEHLDDTTIRLRQATDVRSFYLLLLGRLGPVALAVATNLNINFMRKPEPADLLGEDRLLKLGKTLAVGDFTIWSEGKQEPVAHATVTYAIPPRA
jgi:hypothetical protein